jgi:hypothetical protein
VKNFYENFDESYIPAEKMIKINPAWPTLTPEQKRDFVNSDAFRKEFENKQICGGCGGFCCQHMSCGYTVNDFPEFTAEKLRTEIDKGKIAITRNAEGKYILKARNKGSKVVTSIFNKGTCAQLTNKGCGYDYDSRPTTATLLKPNPEGKCETLLDLKHMESEYSKPSVQNVLNELVDYYKSIE